MSEFDTKEIEEDYLDVDKPIPGQNYVCISFVSPEKVIQRKELYSFHSYVNHKFQEYQESFKTCIAEIVQKSMNNTVDVSLIVQLKKKFDKHFKDDIVNFEQFKEKLEDFYYKEEQRIGDEFDEINNFQTSVRGVKVRGVYATVDEARVRAKYLQRTDPTFSIYIAEMGKWAAWDCRPDLIDDNEYANEDLNKIVKGYKENAVKKDLFYEEQKRQRTHEAKTVTERLKKKLEARKKEEAELLKKKMENKPKIEEVVEEEQVDVNDILDKSVKNTDDDEVKFEVGDESSKEVSVSETENMLNSDDPWLQRKMRGE